jgi:DnaJ-class molecular chaperone
MPQSRNPQSKGDMFAKVKISIPRNLTSEQKSLLEEAARKHKGK